MPKPCFPFISIIVCSMVALASPGWIGGPENISAASYQCLLSLPLKAFTRNLQKRTPEKAIDWETLSQPIPPGSRILRLEIAQSLETAFGSIFLTKPGSYQREGTASHLDSISGGKVYLNFLLRDPKALEAAPPTTRSVLEVSRDYHVLQLTHEEEHLLPPEKHGSAFLGGTLVFAKGEHAAILSSDDSRLFVCKQTTPEESEAVYNKAELSKFLFEFINHKYVTDFLHNCANSLL